MRTRLLLLVTLTLGCFACGDKPNDSPGPGDDAGTTGGTDGDVVGDPDGGNGMGSGNTEMIGDPMFDESSLPTSTQLWYGRLLSAMNAANEYPDIEQSASSGDVYQMGRFLGRYVGSLLTVFRLTGDLRLLDRVDEIMQLTRAELADTNSDGYPNWRWLKDSNETLYYGKDTHVMDEIMTHSLVAEVAWAFEQNRSLTSPSGSDYGERATFWAGYLQQWEAKWRERNDKPTGFPFISKNLMHPHLSLIRYLWFMSRITGDAGYLTEATRLANNLNQYEFKTFTTPSGDGVVWAHGITYEEPTNDYFQPVHYAAYSTQLIMELVLEGFAPFTIDDTLVPIANTIAHTVVDNGGTDFAGNFGGDDTPIGGFTPLEDEPRTTADRWAILPMSEYAVFDTTGTIETATLTVYDNIEASENSPRRIATPAAMVIKDLLAP